jgi:hypothetical protein
MTSPSDRPGGTDQRRPARARRARARASQPGRRADPRQDHQRPVPAAAAGPAPGRGRHSRDDRDLIADDQPLVRTGLRTILEADPDFQVVGEATVKTHVSRVLAKLAARDCIQAIVLAYQAGLA